MQILRRRRERAQPSPAWVPRRHCCPREPAQRPTALRRCPFFPLPRMGMPAMGAADRCGRPFCFRETHASPRKPSQALVPPGRIATSAPLPAGRGLPGPGKGRQGGVGDVDAAFGGRSAPPDNAAVGGCGALCHAVGVALSRTDCPGVPMDIGTGSRRRRKHVDIRSRTRSGRGRQGNSPVPLRYAVRAAPWKAAWHHVLVLQSRCAGRSDDRYWHWHWGIEGQLSRPANCCGGRPDSAESHVSGRVGSGDACGSKCLART